ncbi:hypothetical protein CVN68_08530 [Sphingomonas psychrotolerans]|uniref:Uncharacterized protein n=1 Tax=Sphingomonas psychrotolerans TaxID=1327635 RepID=A0A2K8MHK6_9SPHN|nr:hypothetical protein CVN68_08530 [Sphingomonas psychrotolerans]
MSGNQRGKLARNAVLLAALAAAILVFGGKPQATLDVAIRAQGGHAMLRLGSASVRIAFDSGHACPNPNACAGSVL